MNNSAVSTKRVISISLTFANFNLYDHLSFEIFSNREEERERKGELDVSSAVASHRELSVI